MSWDVVVMKFERDMPSLGELGDDEMPVSLGTGDAIRRAISVVFAETDWKDPAWGVWESAGGTIEFQVGDDDEVTCLFLQVRAEPDVVPLILRLCDANGWNSFDGGSGDRIDSAEQGIAALGEWRSYRDGVVESDSPRADGKD